MRRRMKMIGVSAAVVGGLAVVVTDVPSYVLLDRPSLAGESSTIVNEGTSVEGNVPPGFVESLDLPTADELKSSVGDSRPVAVSEGTSRVRSRGESGDAGVTADDGEAEAAAERAEAERREAEARRRAAEAEAEARAEAEAARRDAAQYRNDADAPDEDD